MNFIDSLLSSLYNNNQNRIKLDLKMKNSVGI